MIVLTGATTMTTGDLTSLIAYAMNILNCLMMLSMVMVMINMARASTERIVELFDEESSLTNGEKPVYEMKNSKIIFKNVSFSYFVNKDKECLKTYLYIFPVVLLLE